LTTKKFADTISVARLIVFSILIKIKIQKNVNN
jgi:hypothetical protein